MGFLCKQLGREGNKHENKERAVAKAREAHLLENAATRANQSDGTAKQIKQRVVTKGKENERAPEPISRKAALKLMETGRSPEPTLQRTSTKHGEA